jgi:hypothetical protein
MKYRVYLIGWDFDTSDVIEAKTASKAKGQYIKMHLLGFCDSYPKKMFFNCLRFNRIR